MRPTDLLITVADRLGDLRERVVFIGGTTCELLITDPAAPPVSTTKDVDVIASITATEFLEEISNTLRTRGFRHDISEDAPICRFRLGETMLDFMPIHAANLGFSNRWFPYAFESATRRSLPNGQSIRLISATAFLATKLEAFHDRGNRDYMGHKDIEDIVAVLGGRAEIVGEVEAAPRNVRQFLSERASMLLASEDFVASISGHLPGEDPERVLSRLREIAALSREPA